MDSELWDKAVCQSPGIPLIILYPDGRWFAYAELGQCSLQFYVACLLTHMEERVGQLGVVSERLLLDYVKEMKRAKPQKLGYSQQGVILANELCSIHVPTDECNCYSVVEKIVKLDEDEAITTREDFFHYVERLKKDLNRDFVCQGLKDSLLDHLPTLSNYFTVDYATRLESIGEIQGALVAYEWYEEGEDKFHITCLCDASFDDLPSFDLARAILEHDVSQAALESLPMNSEAALQLANVVEL